MKRINKEEIVNLLEEALENGVREQLRREEIYPGNIEGFEKFSKIQLKNLVTTNTNTVGDLEMGMILAAHLVKILEKIREEFLAGK